jgi:alcohol dehydrogenase YqhD (iron-dependent ADH family)
MIDFDFRNPTRIIFGEGSEKKVGELLREYRMKRVLIVYGSGSIKKTGLYDVVTTALKASKIQYWELGGITPNPDRCFCLKGVEIAKENKVQGILAIGGGSVIDVAKSVGVGACVNFDPFLFNLRLKTPKKTLPVGVVLTIASAGSESSNSCVISDNEQHIKNGFNNDLVRPVFAIEDPVLTFTVSPKQTAAGIADIMMHSMERFFSESYPYQLSDDWALSLIKRTMEAGQRAIKDPTDYDARAALMILSSLSHDGLTGLGKKPVFVVHPLEHAVSAYDSEITHGAGVAVVYLGWARHFCKQYPAKFAQLGRYLFDIHSEDDEKAAIIGIKRMEEFYASIGLPTSLEGLGLQPEDLPKIILLASGNGTRVIGCYPQPLDVKGISEVYSACLTDH